MSESDEQEHGIKGEDRTISISVTDFSVTDFSVTNLRIKADVVLCVSNAYTDEDPDGADLAVAADGVKFSATVTVAETAGEGTWHVGWIQTVYPCSESVTYQNPSGPGRGNMVATLNSPMADGDGSDDSSESDGGDETGDAKHWAWYDDPADCNAGGSVTVAMNDEPNVPFHKQYNGKTAPWIAGWHAVAVAGQKPFCSWLLAETPGGKIVYLYHVAWTVDFGATLADGQLAAVTGSTVITSRGPGKGDYEPCLESKVIADNDPPFLPDQNLQDAKLA